MREILETALAGTSRRRAAGGDAAPDALVLGLGMNETERELLLRAGAWAVYLAAGSVVQRAEAPPEPAAVDARPVCRAAGRLVEELLPGQQTGLLIEALGRLDAAALRLPPEVLPAVLSVRQEAVRAALLPVLGERGRWLSRFNPEWTWVGERSLPLDSAVAADVGALWSEGTRSQRLVLLRRLRVTQPGDARALVESSWRQEKAEQRRDQLAALLLGLAAEDEPFLETALDDRAPSVRSEAAMLLARVPGSALARRMQERAEACLTYEPAVQKGGLRGLMRSVFSQGEGGGTLAVTLPPRPDAAAQRDGISAKPPLGLGEGAWWLSQTLALVPPAHWEERFGVKPEELIAAGERSEWSAPLIEGWSRAAILYGATTWAARLWLWWHTLDPGNTYYAPVRLDMLSGLLICLPQAVAEDLCVRLLAKRRLSSDEPWEAIMEGLPRPWSRAFAERYLETLDAEVKRTASQMYSQSTGWRATLEAAAHALPPELLPRAVEQWSNPESHRGDWQLGRFVETLQTRNRIYQEIPL